MQKFNTGNLIMAAPDAGGTKRANTYAKVNDYIHAIIDLNKAIQINPRCVYYYYNKGVVNDNAKNYKQAIVDYTKAIEVDPKPVQDNTNLNI